jgi:hypothetical protein
MNTDHTAKIYLQTHKFRPHPGGDYGLFGLNMFGSDSTISYTEIDGAVDIWRFIYFKTGSNDAIYINANGIHRTFALGDPNIASRAIRLEEDI